jgi:hypothetical protein
MIFISIARNYAENRKLRGRLLITRSVSRPRNRVLGWALVLRLHQPRGAYCGLHGRVYRSLLTRAITWTSRAHRAFAPSSSHSTGVTRTLAKSWKPFAQKQT